MVVHMGPSTAAIFEHPGVVLVFNPGVELAKSGIVGTLDMVLKTST